jgi:hypothetical protein
MESLFNDPRLPKHFWEKVVIDNYGIYVNNEPCWIWTGFCNEDGYGMCGKSIYGQLTHRRLYSILIHQAPVPGSLHIHHQCEITACCNPSHLEMLTRKEHANSLEHAKITKIALDMGRVLIWKKLSKACIATHPKIGNVIKFKSTRDASRFLNIDHTAILRCCNGTYGYKTAGGLTWQWNIIGA